HAIYQSTQNIATLEILRSVPNPCPAPAEVMALSGGYCVQTDIDPPPVTNSAETITTNDSSVVQSDSIFNRGNAIARAPICAGSTRFPNAFCGATLSTKNTIRVPCIVM